MTDLPLIIALAITVGFQSGCIASWRYYKKQRDEQDAIRRHYEARIEQLENELHHAELTLRQKRRGRSQIKG